MRRFRRFIELNTEVFRLRRLVLRRLEGLPPVMQEKNREMARTPARMPRSIGEPCSIPFHTRLIQPFERGRPRRGRGPYGNRM
jgi:hypothetical protein